MNQLKDKVAVITGGSSGIGLATARRFAAEGARVVLFARSREALEIARDLLDANVTIVAGDVGIPADQARLFDEVRRVHGRVDVLFANAAVVKLASIGDTDDRLLDAIVSTNLRGSFLSLRHALPLLSDGAAVILTTSWLNRVGFPGSSAVAMTKAAIRALARVAAAELGPRGIRVNALAPGAIETPLWSKLGLPEATLAAAGADITRQVPLGRWGRAEELAEAALYLASHAATYVNGIELQVDGGLRQV